MRLALFLFSILPAFAVTTVVQSTGAYTESNTTQSVSFGSLPTVGNVVLWACGNENSSTAATVSDNQSNSYSVTASSEQFGISMAVGWALVSTSSGTFTVTCAANAFTSKIYLYIIEITGMNSSPVDVFAIATGGSGGGTSFGSGTTSTRTQANDVLFGVFFTNSLTSSAGAGYSGFTATTGTTYMIGFETQTVSAVGTDEATITMGSFKAASVAVIAIKDAGGGGARRRLAVIQ